MMRIISNVLLVKLKIADLSKMYEIKVLQASNLCWSKLKIQIALHFLLSR